MKKIIVDNKTYYLKEDVEAEIKELKKDGGIKVIKDCIMFDDKEHAVTSVGTVELGEDSITTMISVELLEKAIEFLKLVEVDPDSLYMSWAKGHPVCLGTLKKSKLTGFIIAPRVKK